MVTSDDDGAAYHDFLVSGEHSGQRLDKALTALADAAGLVLSRSRIVALIGEGAVGLDGVKVENASRKVHAGQNLSLVLPAPAPAAPEAEAIPLTIVHEDADLVVIDKPAGMVVHPAPGAETGTLVNALLAHCGEELLGIGGERRPGIVHRIDKDTSGLLVVAKSEQAMTGLAAQFADHSTHRRYTAIASGAPDRRQPRLLRIEGASFTPEGDLRVETMIARDPRDRKRMAVVAKGRRAVTFLRVEERFGPVEKPLASLLSCRLLTGRTHQIRVHAAHLGHKLIGDPVYGQRRTLPKSAGPVLTTLLNRFPRQALHAAELGFRHPTTGEELRFSSDLPPDMNGLLRELRRNTETLR